MEELHPITKVRFDSRRFSTASNEGGNGAEVRGPEDVRRHYLASIQRRDTTMFVENLEVANNAMLDRLRKIGKAESEGVHLIELSRDLRKEVRTDLLRQQVLAKVREDSRTHSAHVEAATRGHNSDLGWRTKKHQKVGDPKNGTEKKNAGKGHGGEIQIRDIRCLQILSDPALFVRIGAIVVSLGGIRCILTPNQAYFILPAGDFDGSKVDMVLERLKSIEDHHDVQMRLPFQLMVLEAIVISAIQVYMEHADAIIKESELVTETLRTDGSLQILRQVCSLKGVVAHLIQEVNGAKDALENVQRDPALMALMMTCMHDSGAHAADRRNSQSDTDTSRCSIDNIEILLDAYALELSSLATRLSLTTKQINAAEDSLDLNLEHAQKETFRANAIFRFVIMLLGFPTVVTAFFGLNLWSGVKLHLEGPGYSMQHDDLLNDTSHLYNLYYTTNGSAVPVSWVFVWNSGGVVALTLGLAFLILSYLYCKGYAHFSGSEGIATL